MWARADDLLVHWDGRTLLKYPTKAPPPRRGRHGFAGGWRLTQDHLTHPGRPAPPTSKAGVDAGTDFWAFGADDVWAVRGGSELLHFDGRTWTVAALPPL